MDIVGSSFVDDEGRSLVLRGVNLGGDSKFPSSPDGRTHLKKGFYEGRAASFIGRPFPLGAADAHFERLSRWGLRFVRLLVTWEAVEHGGPGVYDEAYLDYLEGIVEAAARRGLSLFIDPHQDAWSRWSGGDGAPLWTLEELGFEPRTLQAAGAATLHQEMGDSYPSMRWFANYSRLAAATMFSLFFAGDVLAPGLSIQGEPVQAWLQGRYIEAMRRVALRLAPYPNVAGFGSMNEPGYGWIGMADARSREGTFVTLGAAPSPWESMLAGEGLPTTAEELGVLGLSIAPLGRKPFGTPGVRAWKDGVDCLWRRAGVWDLSGGRARLLDPGRFAAPLAGLGGARPYAAFNERCLKPFITRYAEAVRSTGGRSSRWAIFVEGVPEGGRPDWGASDIPRVVNASHWYDSAALYLKRWAGLLAYDAETGGVSIGPRAARASFASSLARLAAHSRERMGGCPTLVGEFGLPFDMDGRRGLGGGDYRPHEKALSAYYDALDASLLSATIWNYSAGNAHAYGDGWNAEDLSVFCADEALAGRTESGDQRDAGGRALRGFVRPYPLAVAGSLVSFRFDLKSGLFELAYVPDPAIAAPTEVFMPRLHYPRGFSIRAEGCAAAVRAGSGDGPVPVSEPAIIELRPLPGSAGCRLAVRRNG